MSDPQTTGFIPKWLRDESFAEDDAFPLMAGSIPDTDPRVVTRLVPKDHGYRLAARTVSRIIDLKQDLVLHAARDVTEGFNPNFADLTSIPKSLRENAALTIEPAEPGSFVIPATLPVRSETLDPDTVLKRYSELLSAVDDVRQVSSASIGALQVCRELGRLLRRDIETIEVTTFDRENAARPMVKLNAESVIRIDRLLDRRRTSTREFEKLTGRLEALDIGKNEFQLKIANHSRRVKGTAAFFAITSLREYLGAAVTLEGEVVRDRKSITMTAYRVVEGEDA
jgi:hypothetical protein